MQKYTSGVNSELIK